MNPTKVLQSSEGAKITPDVREYAKEKMSKWKKRKNLSQWEVKFITEIRLKADTSIIKKL